MCCNLSVEIALFNSERGTWELQLAASKQTETALRFILPSLRLHKQKLYKRFFKKLRQKLYNSGSPGQKIAAFGTELYLSNIKTQH